MANVSSSNGLEKYPKLRFPSFDEPWKEIAFSQLYRYVSEKNDGTIGTDRVISVANMYFKPDARVSSADYLKTYNLFRHGDIAFEGNKSKNFAFGRFVENTIGDGIVSHVFTVFRPIASNHNLDYWSYAINNENVMRRILSRCTKKTTMMTNLVTDDFLVQKICCPSEMEQQKIARFLKKLDDKIEKQTILVETLKKYKRGLVFQTFCDNNTFGFDTRVTPMSDLLTEYRNRDTINLRVCSVAVNKGVVDQVEHLGRSFAAADTSNYGRVKPGDIVYTKSPTGNFPYGIVKQNWLDEEVAVSPLYGVYTPISESAGYLLHTYFEQSQNANNYIRTLAQKGAKNTINISTSHFLDKSIIFPCDEGSVTYLAKLFAAISSKISFAEKTLELLLCQRKTLLQQLFI